VDGKALADLHPELTDRQHILTLRSDEVPAWQPGYSYLDALGDWECYVWVRKAVKVLADNFASVPLRIQRDNTLTDKHDLLTLLTDVNDQMSSYNLWEQYIIDMMLGGEEGWELVRGKRSKAYVEIWPRQPHTIKVVPDKALKRYFKVAEYVIDDMQAPAYPLPPDEFLHFKFFNPRNPWRGISPFTAVKLSIVIDQLAQIWERLFFKNSARPDFAVISTASTKDERDEIRKQLKGEYGGVGSAHEPIVLEKDVSDIKTISWPPKDLHMETLRAMSRDEVAAIVGVPDMVMGYGADTYDTEEKRTAALRMLWSMTIVPLATHRDVQMTEYFRRVGVLRPDESVVSDFSHVSVLQADFGAKVDQANTLFGLGVPLNVINARLDLGLPSIAGGNVGYLPLNLVPIGTAQPTPPKRLKAANTIEYDGDEHKRLDALHKQRLTPRQRRVRQATIDIFQQQQQDVAAGLRAADDLAAFADDPLDRDIWDERAASIMLPVLSSVMADVGNDALDDLGLDGAFDGELPHIVEAMRRQAQRFAQEIDETTWDRLRNSLGDGLENGEGLNRLMERVEEVMADRIRSSSETIARTETVRATSTGTREAWKQSGIVEDKQWISALIPGRTRDDHAAAHGQAVGLEEDFDVGGCSGPGPGETGCADQDINCLCSMAAVVVAERRRMSVEIPERTLVSGRRLSRNGHGQAIMA
jgi:HK97 family phage portal protein